jgi:hypothetical protein
LRRRRSAAPRRPENDADLGKSAAADRQGKEAIEHIEVFDEGIVAMRDHILPLGAAALTADGYLHQAKIARLPVGSDDEGAAEMLHLVLMVAFVRQKGPELEHGVVSMCVPPLRGHRALHVDEDESIGLRFGNAGIEASIFLFEGQCIVPRVGS